MSFQKKKKGDVWVLLRGDLLFSFETAEIVSFFHCEPTENVSYLHLETAESVSFFHSVLEDELIIRRGKKRRGKEQKKKKEKRKKTRQEIF